jgi:FO synthase
VLRETGLLPHVNPGVMTRDDIAMLRKVSVSQGIMLESTAERLCARGGVHFGSPDKAPAVRLATLQAAGELQVRSPRHSDRHRGNARGAHRCAARYSRVARSVRSHPGSDHPELPSKPGTAMAGATEPERGELEWTLAMAR